jgi:hypothetical protein
VAASQCCYRHILSGRMPAEGPLAGGNGDSGSIVAAGRWRHLVLAAGGWRWRRGDVAFVQCWILNFVIVFVYSYHICFRIWPFSHFVNIQFFS